MGFASIDCDLKCDYINVVLQIRLAEAAVEHLKALRLYDRKTILGAVRAQLSHEPTTTTRHRKQVVGLELPWAPGTDTCWQLAVGTFRVFYDVEDDVVTVDAVRRKPRHKATKEI